MEKYQIDNDVPREEWDRFIRSSPQDTVFLYSDFLDSLLIPYKRVVCRNSDHIAAGCVLFLDDQGDSLGLANKYMLYQGVALAGFEEETDHHRVSSGFNILTNFLEQLEQEHKKICLVNSWRLEDMRPFLWLNYHDPQKGRFDIKLKYTGIIPLMKYQSFEEYLHMVKTIRKREYKRSRNVSFETTDDIDGFIDLHNKTYLRQGLDISQDNDIYRRSIIKHNLQNGLGKMVKATLDDGTIASIKFFLYDNNCAYYLFGANEPDARNSGASTGLMFYFIEDALKNGKQWFDFCGVNSPARGDYKISFNAKIYPYFIATYARDN